ncbi:hypothetical protein P280DRAFT_118359 [Massarina eburnea CBS 473.64]|uniref:Uncharacterized protein n=1 Tax=Massarina eburnea CBS 473.64 TaxID=1395130 RepID=A0A6A6SE19_9PLEO|nr:hypothetical protein P280DRAFT_118359 [Massarina eburnea CBS 473.64]
MSWSGPVAGAPYQPPSYANGQQPFSQPPAYQYGQQPPYAQYQAGQPYPPPGAPPRPPESRPLKKKGNPIITRYPPPPGYRGPAQPQGPYNTQYQPPYQQPQSPYTQGPPAPPAYPNQAFQPAVQPYPPQNYTPQNPQQPTYPPTNYPPASTYQWPQQTQQNYAPQPGYSQPPSYSASQGYAPPQGTYQSYPPQPAPADPSQQPWTQPSGWQQPNPPPHYPPNAQYNSFSGPPVNGQPGADPNATPTPVSAYPAQSQSAQPPSQPQSVAGEQAPGEKPPLFLAWDDWDFDFDGAIWPKANEPVDPDFSLGVIIWRPAKQVTRALPAYFDQAEEQALKPPAEKLGNGESVSIYFTSDNSHEAFLDVRQTDEWYKIRRDPIFVTFTDEEMARNLVPIQDCIALRDRPDEPVEDVAEEDEEMHDATWNVMDGLEQALSSNTETIKTPFIKEKDDPRDQKQEDILAMLGVTGAPKPPSNEPMPIPFPFNTKPASLPEKPPAPPTANIPPRPEMPPGRAHSYSGHRNPPYGQPMQRPHGSVSSLESRTPPNQEYDPWNPRNAQQKPTGRIIDRSRGSPARSEGSDRTAAGSDFESEKPNNGEKSTTLIPQLQRSDSSVARKRSYEDTDNEDGQGRQQDDHTKRKRRTQVDAAYSRR